MSCAALFVNGSAPFITSSARTLLSLAVRLLFERRIVPKRGVCNFTHTHHTHQHHIPRSVRHLATVCEQKKWSATKISQRKSMSPVHPSNEFINRNRLTRRAVNATQHAHPHRVIFTCYPHPSATVCVCVSAICAAFDLSYENY